MAKRNQFKAGQRVRLARHDFYSGVPLGSLGTTSLVATIGGKSVYPDPCKWLVMVRWDEHMETSVPRASLEHYREAKA